MREMTRKPERVLLLLMAFTCLVFGIDAGLLRLGWIVLFPTADFQAYHGALMVCGFLGTLISLERVVAAGNFWAFLGPLCSATGGLTLILGAHWMLSGALITFASAILVFVSGVIFFRQSALYTITLQLGSVCWLVGNLLWLGGLSLAQVAPWWIGFLVLTIAGERLELSRLMRPTRLASTPFVIIVGMFLTGASLVSMLHPLGTFMMSIALLGLTLWLFRFDVARRTIYQQGLTRYIAVCLLSGYVWLLAASLVGLSSMHWLSGIGALYDAVLHAIFVGFVFSMIFGHVPIILPAITRIRIPYHPFLYLPLLILHASLAIRISGDLLSLPDQRSVGGALNALAIVMFVLAVVGMLIYGKKLRKAS